MPKCFFSGLLLGFSIFQYGGQCDELTLMLFLFLLLISFKLNQQLLLAIPICLQQLLIMGVFLFHLPVSVSGRFNCSDSTPHNSCLVTGQHVLVLYLNEYIKN